MKIQIPNTKVALKITLYLMMGLLDFGKVISLTGFKSQVLHNLEDENQMCK